MGNVTQHMHETMLRGGIRVLSLLDGSVRTTPEVARELEEIARADVPAWRQFVAACLAAALAACEARWRGAYRHAQRALDVAAEVLSRMQLYHGYDGPKADEEE